ncbi:MAG: DASH family cryptochrome [Candidatus Marisimplicoccus sp.]
MSKKKVNSLVWFRNNLRVSDNLSLSNCIKNSDRVIGYINIDPDNFKQTNYGFKKTEKFRAKFLLESITDLKKNLKKLNISLIIKNESFKSSINKVIDKYKIDNIYLQNEWTRDELIEEECIPKNIKLIKAFDQFMYSPNDVSKVYENIPRGFSNFRKKCEKLLYVENVISYPSSLDTKNLIDEDFIEPSLSELGFEDFEVHKDSAFKFFGGESNGIRRVNEYFFESKNLSKYKQTRNGLLGHEYSSKISSWLSNGCLSARYVYSQIKRYEDVIEKNDSTYWLFFELIWRDFFKYVSMQHKNKFFSSNGIYGSDKKWSSDLNLLNKWIKGKTEDSFINANMNELAITGFMSNRGRQNVANYLTKELKIDWRIGAEYFESLLIDYDVHSNYGNWLYNAGIGNDSMPFRKFNPKLQSERYDPKKIFEQTWLNE